MPDPPGSAAELEREAELLRQFVLPAGKPFIGLNPDSTALAHAVMTSREKQQIAAAWNAMPKLFAYIDALRGMLTEADNAR